MLRSNWHTHTALCKHASGTVPEYCRAAIAAGLEVLGFSDHTPLPDGRWASVRMPLSALRSYREAIARAAREFTPLEVHAGIECEYCPEFTAFYREVLLGEFAFEYLAAGTHWYRYAGEWTGIYGIPMNAAMLRAYTETVLASIDSGLFAFVAHPDLFGRSYPTWDSEARDCSRAIIEAAKDAGIPLEINAYGFRKPPIQTAAGTRPGYPWRPFWELAGELGAPVIINSDAHRPEDVAAATDECLALARACGLEPIQRPKIRDNAQEAPAPSVPASR